MAWRKLTKFSSSSSSASGSASPLSLSFLLFPVEFFSRLLEKDGKQEEEEEEVLSCSCDSEKVRFLEGEVGAREEDEEELRRRGDMFSVNSWNFFPTCQS
jgi:hypothetical protein